MKYATEVTVLIDHLEDFIKAIIVNHESPAVEDAIALNKKRAVLEDFVKTLAGIEITPTTEPKCPECDSPMKLRTNRQNGDKFWGCTKYPECRGTRDENGLSRAEREELKYKKESSFNQEAGYSFNKKRNVVTETEPPRTD